MEEKDKKLLLKDLCARLSYSVQIRIESYNSGVLKGVDCDIISTDKGINYPLKLVKPYLFPLSSMTEEQKEELNKLTYGSVAVSEDYFYDLCNCSKISTNEVINIVDWLNQNHFDYRSLIEKGLAIDATGLNIY